MELWSQYRDDVQESHEASRLMQHLEASYSEFQGKFQGAVSQFAAELNLNQDKAGKFADKILHLVADMQQENVKHSKHLLDHLIKSGKHGKSLEKHVEKDMLQEVQEEEQHLKEDAADGINVNDQDINVYGNAGKFEDPLKDMLEGFWEVFNDYEKEFSGETRSHFKNGSPVYDQIVDLYAKISGEAPPSEEEVVEALYKIDLASVGAPLNQGRELPANDLVEELVLVPKIPHQELAALEQSWRNGKQDAVAVLSKLQTWHEQGAIPSGWLQLGVNHEEQVLSE